MSDLAPVTLSSVKKLYGKKVVGGKKDKKVGKVHNFVFHPTEKRLVGFLVKRPDAALMFHRKDLFVALDGYELTDEGAFRINDDSDATEHAACKRLGVKLDDCVMWWGMPVMCGDGTTFGTVDDVEYDAASGQVHSVTVEQGATAKFVLGGKVIPAKMVKGFTRGMGAPLAAQETDDGEFPPEDLGAILVSEQVKQLNASGGMAEKAGAASAVASHKVKKVVVKAKPKVDQAGKAASAAAEKGLYATGRQLGRTKGMFKSFKDEFDKASK